MTTQRARAALLTALTLVALNTITSVPSDAHAATYGQFSRPSRPLTFDSPEGHIRVHYDTQGPAAVDTAYVDLVGSLFEQARAEYVEVQGWREPIDDSPLGGDGRTDVYLVDGDGNGFTSADRSCDAPCSDASSYVVMDAALTGDQLTYVAVHELHHVIQYTVSAATDLWLREATADFQAFTLFPSLQRGPGVEDYATSTSHSLTEFFVERAPDREYGAHTFVEWLVGRHDIGLLQDAWRATLDTGSASLPALDAALGRRGSSFATEFTNFAAASMVWDTPDAFPRIPSENPPVLLWPVSTVGPLDAARDTAQVVLPGAAYAAYDVVHQGQVGARVATSAPIDGALALVVDRANGATTRAVMPLQGATAEVRLDGLGPDDVASLVVVNASSDAAVAPAGELEGSDVTFAIEVGRDIAPAPGPATPQSELLGGGRVTAEDPVGQAIATSRALFADGEAERVVLARSDVYADAMAGTALAGDAGPILLTPLGADLDARVVAEIGRVTGGQAPILVLGGTNAVTDSAARQAGAAGGSTRCTAPLPSSCRYDGFGRENTARLIAQTVQTEHGGHTVLVARGDEFAEALTGGAYAAATGTPVLLTPSNMPNADTRAFLDDHPDIDRVVVLGGMSAVDSDTATALDVTQRVAGAERTATSTAIATDLWEDGPVGAVLVNVRTADGWQAGLTAAVASARFGVPQLGVEDPPAGLSTAVSDYLAERAGPVQAFGGTGLVSDAQLAAAGA